MSERDDWMELAAAGQRQVRGLNAELVRLSALVPRWVPVGERLPPQSTLKWVLICGRDYNDRLRCTQFGDWFDSDGCGRADVTHWLEVPIPPLPGTETP